MDASDHLDHLARQIQLLSTVDPTSLQLVAPSCPAWTGAELVRHLGSTHRWANSWLTAEDPSEFPAFPDQPTETGPQLIDWLITGANELHESLSNDDPERTCGSFLGPTTVAWWIRRQTIETAIHRWDLELISANPTAFTADLAGDAIEEWCALQVARGWDPGPDPVGTVHLHGTDAAGEWLFDIDGGLTWTRGHQKGDVAVRGTVSDLLLMLWKRVPPADVDVVGRPELLDRFLASL